MSAAPSSTPAAPDAIQDRTPAHHDMGGSSRFLCMAVERDETPPDAFGRRVDALRMVLGARGLMSTDEMRRHIEAIPEDEYQAITYYERWLRSVVSWGLETGNLTSEDLA